MTSRALAAATVLATLSAAGCAATADKSGGETTPTTVTLASNDGLDTDGASALAHFIELVEKESDGQLQVELSPAWAQQGEQRVLEDVATGEVELGWSGTRAFDLIGVDDFRPLHAPFLIQSYEAERAVVDDDVAQEMLAGLEGSGLTGLAVLGEELRFPAGAESPIVDAADFDDISFGVMASEIQATAIDDLGAHVRQMRAPDTAGLEGFETMWSTYTQNVQHVGAPFVTANLALWPRTSVIVANSRMLDDLDGGDRDVLEQAAAEAAQWSLEHADDQVAEQMGSACASGARVATASPEQLAGLKKAARPTYQALRSDPEQAQTLTRLERLVRAAGPPDPIEVPDGCAYRPADEERLAVPVLPPILDGPGAPGALPEGTYRYLLTQEEIREGVPGMTGDFAAGNAGVWTWTLGNGRWRYDVELSASQVPEGYELTTCEGYYDAHGNGVDFTTVTTPTGECASQTWKAEWRETGTGLQMDVTTDGPDLNFLFGAKPWERIE